MTEQQVRLILQSYRPGSDDPGDPRFAEALREAGRNPQLAHWLKEEQTFDSVIAEKLAQLPEPLGLRTRILALHQPPQSPATSWNLAAILAVVAAVLFLCAQLLSLFRTTRSTDSASVSNYATEMVSFVRMPPPLDMMTENLGALQGWLTKKQTPPINVPQHLRALRPVGCRLLSFRGHDVALICFRRDPNHLAHFFTIDRAALPQIRAGQPPVFSTVGEWTTASWAEGNRVYLIAVQGDEEAVKHYLPHA
jgi:hypothetical protein